MEALKIIESYRQELTDNNIVICDYYLIDEPTTMVSCIDMFYISKYPEFEIVNVIVEIIDEKLF